VIGALANASVARIEPREVARATGGLALLIAAGIHVVVGFEHSASNFGLLSLAAGAAQATLGTLLLVRPSARAFDGIALLSFVLIQLYLVNVTIGLPPAIAHSHVGGTHQVWLLTLAWPGDVEIRGLGTLATQGIASACALFLRGTAGE
jgi:hypothetical protein